MGATASFPFSGSTVTVKIPPLSRVGDQHDEDALATRGAWNGKTGEALYFHVRAVDVLTTCQSEVDLPDGVLARHPNAYELVEKDAQTTLDAIAGEATTVASSAFDYWTSLLRWVTGFHRIGREARIGSEMGWSTYLHDRATDKPVWIQSFSIVLQGVHTVTADEWQSMLHHACAGREVPMHIVLLGDAKHCIDVGDYRRALVDLSVACEVYLRTAVLDSLPDGVLEPAVRLIEEANINQFVTHMFPALLDETGRSEYKKAIKGELSTLLARRNRLMHVASLEGASRENCQRFLLALQALFRLRLRSEA
jgi:hypothetical protein